jgi:uncharacterized metal-binding protein
MVDLPQKKVGIVACSGEELAEGTVARLAALSVLEQLRPSDTVTICLPLFLAGGEGDRAFARFYPTITIDGCEKRCAARGTQMYSAEPAASVVVTDLVAQMGLAKPFGAHHLDLAGQHAVDVTAERVATLVDELLETPWNRTIGKSISTAVEESQEEKVATCSCGSGIPAQELMISGQKITLIALPLIFQQFHEAGKPPSDETARELIETVRLYNLIPDGNEEDYLAALLGEYAAFCSKETVT